MLALLGGAMSLLNGTSPFPHASQHSSAPESAAPADSALAAISGSDEHQPAAKRGRTDAWAGSSDAVEHRPAPPAENTAASARAPAPPEQSRIADAAEGAALNGGDAAPSGNGDQSVFTSQSALACREALDASDGSEQRSGMLACTALAAHAGRAAGGWDDISGPTAAQAALLTALGLQPSKSEDHSGAEAAGTGQPALAARLADDQQGGRGSKPAEPRPAAAPGPGTELRQPMACTSSDAGMAPARAGPNPASPRGGADTTAAIVVRPRRAVAACLACDECGDVLKDPVTAPECMHRRTPLRRLLGRPAGAAEGARACPACARAGMETLLGRRPLRDGRLQPDLVLADLTRKLFPRPAVEAAIQRRLAAERKELARRRPAARAAGRGARPAQLAPGAAAALFVAQAGAAPGRPAEHELARPYLRAAWETPIAVVARHVHAALGLPADKRVQLACNGFVLVPEMSVSSVGSIYPPGPGGLLELSFLILAGDPAP